MFYNAMKRKGWDAREEDMPQVVAIHNTVNERAWQEVRRYARCVFVTLSVAITDILHLLSPRQIRRAM